MLSDLGILPIKGSLRRALGLMPAHFLINFAFLIVGQISSALFMSS